MWDAEIKQCLYFLKSAKFIDREESIKSCTLRFHLTKLEKKQITPKASRKKRNNKLEQISVVQNSSPQTFWQQGPVS